MLSISSMRPLACKEAGFAKRKQFPVPLRLLHQQVALFLITQRNKCLKK